MRKSHGGGGAEFVLVVAAPDAVDPRQGTLGLGLGFEPRVPEAPPAPAAPPLSSSADFLQHSCYRIMDHGEILDITEPNIRPPLHKWIRRK